MSNNPVLTRRLPFQLPDFAAATPADYRAAFEEGMSGQLTALAALRDDPAPATVENVLGAWEDAGSALLRAANAFFAVYASNSTPEIEAIEEEMAPRLAEHEDAIYLDKGLFARLQQLRGRADAGEVALDEQDEYALDETLRAFRRAGVALDDAGQSRLRELNRRLAELSSAFERLNREARNAGAVAVDESELGGLSDEEREALKTDDGYRIELVNTTQQPLAAKLTDASVRRRLLEASTTRALGGDFDTRATLLEAARARAERATLLGYANHAEIVAEAGCAKTTDAIFEMLVPLAQAALAKAREEAAELGARYAELDPGAEFTAADWTYVESIVRRERFAFDESDLAEYLQVDRVLAAVYAAAEELYGLTFHPREDLVGHAPGTQSYEVRDAEGAVIGAGSKVGEETGNIAVVGQNVKLAAGTIVKAGEQRAE